MRTESHSQPHCFVRRSRRRRRRRDIAHPPTAANAKPRGRSRTAPAAFIDPAIPTKVSKPPEGNQWAHEFKHEGYRIQIHITGNSVRLYTMSGYDRTDRYPVITKARGS